MSNYKNNERPEQFEESAELEEKLLALESGEKLQDRENFRAAVRNYQNYFVPFLVNEDQTRQIFKITGLYGLESVPIFLSEAIYLSFQNEYLKKHGYLDIIEERRDTLTVKCLTGKELLEIIPKQSLDSFFVISPGGDEFFFNFNLVEVFINCFHEIRSDFDLENLSEKTETRSAEFDDRGNFNSVSAIRKTARQEIEECQKFRNLFKNDEWIVLISQPTKNKLLKGEVSRDDFDLDRFDDKRIVIFSDLQALDDYKNTADQTQEKLYSIKVDGKRIFGSDLSAYDIIIIDPDPPKATKIGKEQFKKLNEQFTAFEIEKELSQIHNFQKGLEPYSGHFYIDVKVFQNFILPLDTRLSGNVPFTPLNLPVYLVQDASGVPLFPIFTANDCFEAFRFHSLEKSSPGDLNFIEPYYIDGLSLFRSLSGINTPGRIVFNLNGTINPTIFESGFALKVYCA